MPKPKKIFDPAGNDVAIFAIDDISGIMEFAQRSGMDPHDLIEFGKVSDDGEKGQTISFTASLGQRLDSP